MKNSQDYFSLKEKDVLFKDIDSDGKINVLVAVQNQNNFDEEIDCLDHKGNFRYRPT